LWGFPILVAIHIIGLVFSVGIVVWLDLRLLGVSMTGVPVSRVYRRLMPLAFAGLSYINLDLFGRGAGVGGRGTLRRP